MRRSLARRCQGRLCLWCALGLSILLSAFLPTMLQAQSGPRPARVLVEGRVVDAASHEALEGAVVYTADRARGAATTSAGTYRLWLPRGKTRLEAAFLGYRTEHRELDLATDTTLHWALTPQVQPLDSVRVTAERYESVDEAVQMSTVRLSTADLEAVPQVLGEPDVLKAVQLLPGVQRGSEGSTALYVRGGGPDQNLVLLDGLPLYNVSHLFGFFSAFNTDAVEGVQLLKGGFPARFGGRLSSVLDVRTRAGQGERIQARGAVGLLASKLTVDGPLWRERATFLVSARRTYVDLFTRLLSPPTFQMHPYFYDVYARADLTLTPRSHLQASLYRSRDHFTAREASEADPEGDDGERATTSRLGWTNDLAALRWRRSLGRRWLLYTSAGLVDYRLGMEQHTRQVEADEDQVLEDARAVRYDSRVRDVRLALDVQGQPARRHTVRLGLGLVRHRYRPSALKSVASGGLERDTTLAPGGHVTSWEASAYAEDDVDLGWLRLHPGLRLSAYETDGRRVTAWQPRLGLRLRAFGLAWKASYARTR